MERWQIRTTDTRTGDTLCTTEMPRGYPWGYHYESCMFYADDSSDVKDRYDTLDQAEKGHSSLVQALMGRELVHSGPGLSLGPKIS